MDLADKLFENAVTQQGFNSTKIFQDIRADNSLQNRTLIVHHMFSLAERPEAHSKLAGAIAMRNLYKTAPTDLKEYAQMFKEYLREDVVQFIENHYEILQAAVNERFERDFELSYITVGTFISTYLSRLSYDQEPFEIPQFCWMRLAIGQFCSDSVEDVLRVYRRYSNRECIAASPTIFNMGMKKGAPSSCMIYVMDDSLEDIFDVRKEMALASKNNAGEGLDLSGLRHSSIGRQGVSKGIIPLIKSLDDDTIYVNQGGRREGALTISTRIHHMDTYDFIRMVDKVLQDKDHISRANTALMLSDLFMKRCFEGGKWTLFCPKQTGVLNEKHGREFEQLYVQYEEKAQVWRRYLKYDELKKLGRIPKQYDQLYEELCSEFQEHSMPEQIDSREYDANVLMKAICDEQIKSGMPYVIHGCNLNRKNNMCNVGPVRSMNLCQEIAIPAVPGKETGCCNLASISLSSFVRNSAFDFKAFGACVQDLVSCLNRVIDKTQNVSEKVMRSNTMNRPIGIGVNGFADMCHLLDISPTDPTHLPFEKDGQYEFKAFDCSETPSYTPQALLKRRLNPVLAELNYKIWSCMYYHALRGSKEEALKYGPYPNFSTSPTAKGLLQYHLWQKEEKETGRKYPFKLTPAQPSEWGEEGSWDELIEEIQRDGLRNALLLTCMPTASTSLLMGNCESTEFHMQNIYTRKVLSGDYPVMNYHLLNDLQQIGLWSIHSYNQIVSNNGSILGFNEEGLTTTQVHRLRMLKEKYLTMWEIPQLIFVQLAAQRQVFIDHSQSMNIYLARPSEDMLKVIHTMTWKYGLKTGMYYLRSRGANDALKIGQSQRIREEKENQDSTLREIQTLVHNNEISNQKHLENERDQIIQRALLKAGVPNGVKLSSSEEICKLGVDCLSCQ